MSRQAWRDFICAPDRAGRHLSAIGRGVSGSVSDAIDHAALTSFLEKLHDSAEDTRLLGTVIDLIAGGYSRFASDALPRILDALSNEMLAQEQIVGPGLRGNPLWDRTILRRISGTLSPVHYVSRTAHRSFELPENQLLSWLVEDLHNCVATVEKRVGTHALHPDLLRVGNACSEAQNHHWFGDVSRPRAVTPQMLAAAAHHRRPEYRNAAKLAQRRIEMETRDHHAWWYALLSLLAVNWLEPVSDDDLFELFVLVLTLDIVMHEAGFGEPVEYGLVTARRGPVAIFEKGDRRVRVFFDQSPAAVLGVLSAYAQVYREHQGISGSSRRPDILIAIEEGSVTRLVLVEVKKTADGRYISDSVYKVFGYLYDFRAAASSVGIKAVLAVPEGVAGLATAASSRTLFVTSANDRGAFADDLMAAMSL
ncbi:MAG: hypothetical protein RID96_19630 [Nitratireductor sp.]